MTTSITVPFWLWYVIIIWAAVFCAVQAVSILFKMMMYHSYQTRDLTWVQVAYFIFALLYEAGCCSLLLYAIKL